MNGGAFPGGQGAQRGSGSGWEDGGQWQVHAARKEWVKVYQAFGAQKFQAAPAHPIEDHTYHHLRPTKSELFPEPGPGRFDPQELLDRVRDGRDAVAFVVRALAARVFLDLVKNLLP